MASKYKYPVDIIQSLIDRYLNHFPDLFKKLLQYEKELLNIKPNHQFSISDCNNIVESYGAEFYKFNPDIRVVCQCVFSLYQWYKTKIIYNIDTNHKNTTVVLEKYKLKKIPYDSFFIYEKLYKNNIEGCFVSKCREKSASGMSMVHCLLIAFVSHDSSKDYYTMDTFLLPLESNIPIKESMLSGLKMDGASEDDINYSMVYRYSELANVIINNIYNIIDNENREKIKSKNNESVQQTIHRKVKEIGVHIEKNGLYKVNYINKYSYHKKEESLNVGSPKSPHARKAHIRHYPIYDKNGNVTGTKEVSVKSTFIHKENVENGVPTFKNIN